MSKKFKKSLNLFNVTPAARFSLSMRLLRVED